MVMIKVRATCPDEVAFCFEGAEVPCLAINASFKTLGLGLVRVRVRVRVMDRVRVRV